MYYKEIEGKTLLDVLRHIIDTYGYYLDEQVAMSFPGLEGKEKMEKIMADLRRQQKMEIGGIPLEAMEDYLTGKGLRLPEGEEYSLTLPQADVLRFGFQGGGYVMARPSGTEQKTRFYFCVRGGTEQGANVALEKVKSES